MTSRSGTVSMFSVLSKLLTVSIMFSYKHMHYHRDYHFPGS